MGTPNSSPSRSSRRARVGVGRALVFAAALMAPALVRADDWGIAWTLNPLPITLADGSAQTNCADPTILQSRDPSDPSWYAYCTSDARSDADVDPSGARRIHLLPTLKSPDLVHWTNVGDAFAAPPSWAAPGASLWAPELVARGGRYYLYYTVTDVADAVSGEPGCGSDSAIGVATSDSAGGPWVDAGRPVVAPRRAGAGCNFYWTYDPDVVVVGADAYLYYGSYYGGIEARALSADGLSTAPESATPITIPNRYEAAEVVQHDGDYYLFASASNCCNGPLTGYQVFAGRSASPLGPFVDENGVSLLDGEVGGSPVLTLNGNRWVGTGHNSVFQDAAGDWYTAYHAIDRDSPYFAGAVGYTRRPMLLDRLTWDGGWPKVRRGLGASDTPQVAPATAPRSAIDEDAVTALNAALDYGDARAGLLVLDALDLSIVPPDPARSDEFDGAALDPRWTWVRPPTSGAAVAGGAFHFATQAAELYAGDNTASVLTEPAPPGSYVVEAKVALDLPPNGCCFNYVQAGLVVYGDDDDYVKLTHVSIWETRQTEFAKEVSHPPPGYPVYGSGVGGPPGPTTWLRIAKATLNGVDHYVSMTSRDGVRWVRGGTWTHALGAQPRIGLVAFGGAGYTATFDYVRVYALH